MLAKKERILFTQISLTGLYLWILFLGILSYFYGSLFRADERASSLNVLAVDYDGSEIGTAFRGAYSRLQGPSFLSLDFHPPSTYPDIDAVGRTAICSQDYWGVVYTNPGATTRLRAAVNGANQDSTPYNSSDTITFVYNGVYYPVISEAYILAKLSALGATTSSVLHSLYGRELLQATNMNNPGAISAVLDPIRASSIVFSPAEQGTRVLLNTITMVAPPLMQFFFVMALDHISIAVGIFSAAQKYRVYFARLVLSKLFGFVGALVVTAVIYAFRETWDLTGAQFVETWLCFWFYLDISYLVMDSAIGTLVPMRYAPFFIFSWVIVSVTSTLFPFELSPGFYRWSYALPAHNVWLLLMQIWSHGCISRLKIALPVLFMWWLFGHVASAVAVWQKCRTTQPPAHSAKTAVVAKDEEQEKNKENVVTESAVTDSTVTITGD